jgi:ribosomal protein S18 acetylase RimI-like enzyme
MHDSTVLHAPPEIRIRWPLHADMQTICDIDEACYPECWNAGDFRAQLIKRDVLSMVAEYQGRIRGFCLYRLYRNRIEFLRLAVQPGWQRFGVGSALMRRTLEKLSKGSTGRTRLLISVPERDLGSQLFLKACGLKGVQVGEEIEFTGGAK